MLRMVLCATLLVRRGAGVAMRTVASQAKRKNAPAQAQGVFEALDRAARQQIGRKRPRLLFSTCVACRSGCAG